MVVPLEQNKRNCVYLQGTGKSTGHTAVCTITGYTMHEGVACQADAGIAFYRPNPACNSHCGTVLCTACHLVLPVSSSCPMEEVAGVQNQGWQTKSHQVTAKAVPILLLSPVTFHHGISKTSCHPPLQPVHYKGTVACVCSGSW